MIVLLLVVILAVLLLGAPRMLEWSMQAGFIALVYAAGFIVLAGAVSFAVGVFHDPIGTLLLVAAVAAFAVWIWAFAKFRVVRWGVVVVLVVLIAVAQLWPMAKIAAG